MKFSKRGVLKACATTVAGLALSLAAHAADPVKIGAVLCTSGPFANLGLDEMRGAQLAVEHINAVAIVAGDPQRAVAGLRDRARVGARGLLPDFCERVGVDGGERVRVGVHVPDSARGGPERNR